MGRYRVERTFAPDLSGKAVTLRASWDFGAKRYDELCVFAVDPEEKRVGFWSFTSRGERSQGWLVEAPDLPGGAIAFEADMPAGRARQAYFPGEDDGMTYVVEARRKTGWSRFLEQDLRRVG